MNWLTNEVVLAYLFTGTVIGVCYYHVVAKPAIEDYRATKYQPYSPKYKYTAQYSPLPDKALISWLAREALQTRLWSVLLVFLWPIWFVGSLLLLLWIILVDNGTGTIRNIKTEFKDWRGK